MFDLFLPLFTRENIAIALSIITAGYTVFSAVRRYLAAKISFSIEVKDYEQRANATQFFMYVYNESTSPLCVSRVFLLFSGQAFECELLPKLIRKDQDQPYKTLAFPLNVHAGVGTLEFVHFLDVPDMQLAEGTTVHFEFHANHCRLRKSVVLPRRSHYLHMQDPE